MLRKFLLLCGIAASLLYAAINILVPPHWDGYSVADQAVSELSAIGAPTRALWLAVVWPYSLLMIGFGAGIRMSAGGRKSLSLAGALILAQGVTSLYWPAMHLRGAEMTLTDVLHIVWASVTVLIMFAAIGAGAFAFGKGFRLYSLATLIVFLIFGTLTGLQGPDIAANLPTPRLGIWERINIGAFLIWVAALALRLWTPEKTEPTQ